MNLDQTFCANDCENYKCHKNLGLSHVLACISQGRDPETLSWSDQSEGCKDYQPTKKPFEGKANKPQVYMGEAHPADRRYED